MAVVLETSWVAVMGERMVLSKVARWEAYLVVETAAQSVETMAG